MALIAALIDAGETSDAEPLINEMLQRQPNDGRVNLIAARLMNTEGKPADAEAYYHRAIYGEWSNDPDGRRIAARMELIDQLIKRNRKQELLAELISLEAEPTASAEIRKRLAQLFLLADSPARAADIYRVMTTKNPKDIAAYEGLGEAELEQGQYNAARAAFLQGFLQSETTRPIQSHLQTLNTVVALDPTLRKLTSEEKYRRSIQILEMARTGLAACVAKTPEFPAMPGKPPAHVTNEEAENVLTLAESVWRARNQACSARSEEQDALNLVMKKLAS